MSGLSPGDDTRSAGKAGFLGAPNGFLKQLRFGEVVGVEEREVASARHVQSGVAGGALALVRLMDNAHAPVECGHAVEQASRAVGGAVVHADELEVGQRLSQHAFHALSDMAGAVVRRHDDGDDGGVAHVSPYPLA